MAVQRTSHMHRASPRALHSTWRTVGLWMPSPRPTWRVQPVKTAQKVAFGVFCRPVTSITAFVVREVVDEHLPLVVELVPETPHATEEELRLGDVEGDPHERPLHVRARARGADLFGELPLSPPEDPVRGFDELDELLDGVPVDRDRRDVPVADLRAARADHLSERVAAVLGLDPLGGVEEPLRLDLHDSHRALPSRPCANHVAS